MPDPTDHFSTLARQYRRYRPAYPDELFAFLAGLCTRRERAWDCGAGSGQAADGLVRHFQRVITSDVSRSQVAAAPPAAGIDRVTARAEAAPIRTASIDLVTVAQALHWFANEAFFEEVRRVSRNGVVAAWSYGRVNVPGAEDVIAAFYAQIDPYWPPERRLVDEHYDSIPFPFAELPAPGFAMTSRWTRDALAGYVGTWSACKRARDITGNDPLPGFVSRLAAVWDDRSVRTVSWPMRVRVARVSG